METEKLRKIIADHKKWLNNKKTYLVEKDKMCNSVKSCEECPINSDVIIVENDCEIINIKSAIKHVQEWAEETNKPTTFWTEKPPKQLVWIRSNP